MQGLFWKCTASRARPVPGLREPLGPLAVAALAFGNENACLRLAAGLIFAVALMQSELILRYPSLIS